MEHFQIGDKHIAYRVSGTGETVLLLHGSAGSHILWRRFSRRLEVLYRVLAPDIPGYGSSSFGCEMPPPVLAADVEPLMALVRECDGLHIVGYSYGAVLALGLAIQLSKRVSSLTLIEPVTFQILRDRDDKALFERAADWRRLFERLVACGETSAAMENFFCFWANRLSWVDFPEEVRYHLILKVDRILRDITISFDTKFEQSTLGKLTFPTLVIYGAKSIAPVRRIAMKLGNLMAGSMVAEVSDGMHDILVTHCEQLSKLVFDHITDRPQQIKTAYTPTL